MTLQGMCAHLVLGRYSPYNPRTVYTAFILYTV